MFTTREKYISQIQLYAVQSWKEILRNFHKNDELAVLVIHSKQLKCIEIDYIGVYC